MAVRAKRMCTYPGCPELVQQGSRCDKHKRTNEYDKRRASSTERGYDKRWQRYRLGFLRRNSICIKCLEIGDIIPATVVDHVTPHKGDMQLFWDISNHQALCKRCHDIKTAKEDGGFNNPRRG